MASVKMYHGSNCEVKNPALSYGREDADFGIGFYVTADVEMAEKWAARRSNPIINVYTVDLDDLNGLEFGLNKGWLDFVVQNRSGNKRVEIDLSEERRNELKNMLSKMRKETNEIVEKIMRDKMKEANEKIGPMPTFRKKRGR